MKTKFKQRTWYATDEAERDLQVIAEEIGEANDSQAIRYALRKVREMFQKESA